MEELLAKQKELLENQEELEQENRNLKEEVSDLRQQLAMYKKALYGQRSEKTSVILDTAEQLNLFDEAETEASRKGRETEPVVVGTHTRKPKRTHDEMLKDLPVEEVVHQVADKICNKCGSEMKAVGKEFVRDELIYIPAKLFVRKHYAEVVKCTSCGTNENEDAKHSDTVAVTFRKANVPYPLISHSFCSPELLAHIIYEKYIQAVPLYRQEKDFSAMGVKLSRNTMANWMIYAAREWCLPVWKQMKAELLSGTVLHADETVVQVHREPGKKDKTDSRMWVYCAPKSAGYSNILFQYTPTRAGAHAVKFLGNYRGYLVCDGYDGYGKLKNVTRCGCFAHVRRKFTEALPTDKELLASSKAAEGLEWCNKLFSLEREYEQLTPEEKQKQRQERSKAVLDGFFAWLNTVHPAGGSKLAKAVQYALNEKKCLYSFLDDSNIPIDNNCAENAIRPFVIGRKNWLFSDSVKGAEASGMIYSLAVTAAANGLNVEQYFTKLISSHAGIMPW